MTRSCPRDGAALQVGTGALAEDVCGACQGRFLDQGATHRLFVEILGIRAELLMELARAGVPRAACPACGTRLSETVARGVTVDLCRGCGGAWLDAGELARLARDVIEEVRVAGTSAPAQDSPGESGLTLDLQRPPPAEPFRFEVLCVSCDEPLDLSKVNWLVNTRPWCPSCAAPYTGLASLFDVPLGFTSVLGLLGRGSWGRLQRVLTGEGLPVNRSADVLRISPADAEQFFAPFFVRAR